MDEATLGADQVGRRVLAEGSAQGQSQGFNPGQQRFSGRQSLGPLLRALAMIIVILLFAACSGNGSSERAASASTQGRLLRLVILGDSTAGSDTCPGCKIYPEQLASAMREALGVGVEVDNLAWAVSNPKPAEVADLLRFVRRDSAARDSVAGADAVVVTVGHNDLAYNRLDDPCHVAPKYPRVKWSSITHSCIDRATDQYRHDLDALLGEIDGLRTGQPTMLRVTTVYNSVIDDQVDPTWDSPTAIEPSTYAVERMVTAQCQVARQHHASCADTYHALNGKDGSGSAQPFLNDADATHLAQPGEDAFSAALIQLGFAPLQ
jgi:hypothetical protein